MHNYWTPILFMNPDDEKASMISLATAIFEDFQTEYCARGMPPPTVEDVFPQLASLVSEHGNMPFAPIIFEDSETFNDVERQRLIDAVGQAFDLAPHAVRTLLDAPQEATMPTLKAPPTLPAIHSQPEIIPLVPVSQKSPLTTSQSRRDKAYDVAQTLLSCQSIKILGEAIYCYTGCYYAHITPDNLRRLIMGNCREAVASEGNARLVDEIFKLLMCEPQICDNPESIATDLVSFHNGVWDLKNHRLLHHAPHFNTYYCLSANKIDSTYHPIFDAFLDKITDTDQILRQRIWEIMGYCLVPDMSAKAFFVFQGVPDSGKSVLAKFLMSCFNPDAVVAVDLQTLGDRFAASSLIGKQLSTSMDMPDAPLNPRTVSTFKMITGGDLITADVKYRPAITFLNRAKFVLGSNHPLLTQNENPAFSRRAICVPFSHTIPPHQQDRSLFDKLIRERDAIICSALQAYNELHTKNYQFAGDYPLNGIFYQNLGGLRVMRSEETALEEFIRDNFKPDSDGIVFIQDLQEQFQAETNFVIPPQTFSAKFLEACNRVGIPNVQRIGKKRKETGGNPQACLSGLSFINR